MLSPHTKAYLDARHVPYEVLVHAEADTAGAAARAAQVPAHCFAKVVVVQAHAGHPVMVVLPAGDHVDLAALAEFAGEGPFALVAEDELARLFPDCELGAMPPFGNVYGLPVYVERSLAAGEEIAFAAGSHREALRMRYADFARAACPVVASVAAGH